MSDNIRWTLTSREKGLIAAVMVILVIGIFARLPSNAVSVEVAAEAEAQIADLTRQNNALESRNRRLVSENQRLQALVEPAEPARASPNVVQTPAQRPAP